MNTLKMTFISLPVLAILLTVGAVDEAQARIRVKGSIKTPHGVIQVDNGPHYRTRGYRPAPRIRPYVQVRVTKKDKRIARRLGRYTGVPKRELVQMRKQGYSWKEIGRWLGVSKKAIRASRTQARWERFLDRQRGCRYHEVGGYYND